PTARFANGNIILSSVAQNVKVQSLPSSVHQPILFNAKFPIHFTKNFRIFLDGTWADDFQDHVRHALEFDVTSSGTLDHGHTVGLQTLLGNKNRIRSRGEIGSNIA